LFTAVGRFDFRPDRDAVVTISNRETSGHVIVDAVRFVQLDAAGQPIRDDSVDEPQQLKRKAKLEQSRTEVAALEKELKQLEAGAPAPLPKAFAPADSPEISDCELCIRGEHKQRGEKVPRGVLQVATLSSPPRFPDDVSGRRE